MVKTFEPQISKFFKTPKYTGITLSLISMFVLASMFVVWERIPKNPLGEKIQVLADESIKSNLLEIASSFHAEVGSKVDFTFSQTSQMSHLMNQDGIGEKRLDLVIFKENKDMQTLAENLNLKERIPLCFMSDDKKGSSSSLLLTANLTENTLKSREALQFARYLAAPSKGQFVFAKSGLVGVNGDFWTKEPNLRIFLSTSKVESLHTHFSNFENREGVEIEVQKFILEEIPAALEIISNSKAKHFLPNLIFTDSPSLNLRSLGYSVKPMNLQDGTPIFVMHLKNNSFYHTSARLMNHLSSS